MEVEEMDPLLVGFGGLVLAQGASGKEGRFVMVEGMFETLSNPWSRSIFEVPELSILMVTGVSEIEVAFVLREEVLEDEESLPDSSGVEEQARVLVKTLGLDPALEVIWSINRSRFFLGGSNNDFVLMVSEDTLRASSVSG